MGEVGGVAIQGNFPELPSRILSTDTYSPLEGPMYLWGVSQQHFEMPLSAVAFRPNSVVRKSMVIGIRIAYAPGVHGCAWLCLRRLLLLLELLDCSCSSRFRSACSHYQRCQHKHSRFRSSSRLFSNFWARCGSRLYYDTLYFGIPKWDPNFGNYLKP